MINWNTVDIWVRLNMTSDTIVSVCNGLHLDVNAVLGNFRAERIIILVKTFFVNKFF